MVPLHPSGIELKKLQGGVCTLVVLRDRAIKAV
jgi:hypothetical protein